jgi:hypothetical protein
MEQQVQQALAAAQPSALERRVGDRLLQSRLEAVEAASEQRAAAAQAATHSLYRVRSHWGGLKRLLLRLLHTAAGEAPRARVALASLTREQQAGDGELDALTAAAVSSGAGAQVGPIKSVYYQPPLITL